MGSGLFAPSPFSSTRINRTSQKSAFICSMYMSSHGFCPNHRSWPHGGCHLTPWEWICGCSRIIQIAQPGVASLRSDAGQPVAWWQKSVYHGASYSPPSGRSHRRNNATLSSAPLPVRSEGADRFQHVWEPSFALPQMTLDEPSSLGLISG